MKKITRLHRLFTLFILFFGTSLFLWNCEINEEHVSHDPDVNSWVLENQEKIKIFNRKTIATYAPKYHKAILKLQTSERKKIYGKRKLIT